MALDAIQTEKPEALRVTFPYNDLEIQVDLIKKEITTSNFKVQTDKGYYNDYQKGVYYWGIIADDTNSLATFSFFENQLIAVVSSKEYGDINIGKLSSDGNNGNYIIYSSLDLLVDASTKCQTPELKSEIENNYVFKSDLTSVSSTTKSVRIYYELDYYTYAVTHSANITTALNWMTAMHNNVSAVYANDGISSTPVSEIFIWTTQSPFYQWLNTEDLQSFVKYRSSFNGDIANLVVTEFGGTGFAYSIYNMCKSSHGDISFGEGPYTKLGLYNQFENFPIYSFNIKLICHEIGHVLGSRHTYQCVWNGNNTQIDDCGTDGGACYDPNNPIIPELYMGTIMSYCGGALAAGFGPQPTQVMINTIENATCLGNDGVISCSPSIRKLEITEVGQNSAKLTIVDDNPNSTSWKFRVLPNDFITINTNPFIIEGLSPKQIYDVEVKQICEDPFIADYINSARIHTAGVYCSEYIADYGYDPEIWWNPGFYSYQTTLFPTNNNYRVSLHFVQFNTPTDEGLSIYNGPDTSFPLLAYYSGNYPFDNIAADLVSTHTTGSLTLEYKTNDDLFSEGVGFLATTTCVGANLSTPEFSLSSLKYNPNPVKDILNFEANNLIEFIKIVDMQGRIIKNESVNDTRGIMDLSSYASGIYIAFFYFENRFERIRIIKD